MPVLAINGGVPVRPELLPYARQTIDEEDIAAVTEALKSNWLTTGPKVQEFEKRVALATGAGFGVAVSNGTAALHAAYHALGVQPGDEVIVPVMTFAATVNAVLYNGGTPVFCDVQPGTFLIDPLAVEAKLSAKTKAIVGVDFAGQACDYDALRAIAERAGVPLVADACHSLGGKYRQRPVGSLADLTVLSFHAVKHITTGEGGMVLTDSPNIAEKLRRFRSHGITADPAAREKGGTWFYEMETLGYNYRLSDIQCALGLSQLKKLPLWIKRRQAIAAQYDRHFHSMAGIEPLPKRADVEHAYHLYVVRLDLSRLTVTRKAVYEALRAEGIGVNVHYIPVHLHPFYRDRMGGKAGQFPFAEAAYETCLTLPCFPAMTDADVGDVVHAVEKVLAAFRR